MGKEKKAEDHEIELTFMPLYKTTFDTILKMNPVQVQEIILALGNYFFYDQPAEKLREPLTDHIYRSDTKLLDSSKRRYIACKINGSTGGAPKGNLNSRKQPLTAEEHKEFLELKEKVWDRKCTKEEANRYDQLAKIIDKYGFLDEKGNVVEFRKTT